MGIIIISSVTLSSLITSLIQMMPTISNQQISALESSQNLVDDSEAMAELKEIVTTYKHRKQTRLKDGSTDIFRQEDLVLFNNFIEQNNNTNSALTAKLIIATLLSRYAIMPDLEFPKYIYQKITEGYLDRWQGRIAKRSLMVLEFMENDPKLEKPENLIALRDESEKLLDTSEYLDNSTRPDIQAFCSLDNFPWVYITLESLAKINRDLGEYEKSEKYYKKIIELYPDTNMDQRAKSSINHLQSMWTDASKIHNLPGNTKPIADKNHGIALDREDEKNSIVTVTEEQDGALHNEDTESQYDFNKYSMIILLICMFAILPLILLVLLHFKRGA